MIGAYYSKVVDSKEVFNNLNISDAATYEDHLNKYNVINISFNRIPDKNKSYEGYVDLIQSALIDDIKSMYPNLEFKSYFTISDMLFYTKDKFIFIFDEFTFLKDRTFDVYFGFTEDEVERLCAKNKKMKFKDIELWYNGYLTAKGIKIYNPRSVVKALQNNYLESYWTNTGAMDEVTEYLKYNTLEIRDDVIEMVADGEIDIIINEEFRAGQGVPKTKEEIYSAMIVLGFLSYYDGYLKIPNKELMKEFERALRDKSFGYVSEIIENSKKMLNATIARETKIVEEILHDIHNSEIPILQYNDENSLSCVLTLAYLSARDTYRIEKEEKTGKGFADFAFHPRRKNDTPFIVELKKDEVPEVAINQIRKKEYVEKFRKENEYKKVLAVAICYDSKEKEHNCKIEEI